MLVVPQEGSLALMQYLRLGMPAPIMIHLFINDLLVDTTTVLTDFTEASFPGYLAQAVTFPAAPFLNIDGAAEIDAGGPASFVSTGPSTQTAYGYWVDDGSYTSIWWAERFASPVDFRMAGSFTQVVLALTGITEFTG